ncbi:MAG: right-handed parallel beta-helix repeat-containing protein [Myxococcaceae bacterium]
MTSSRTRVVLLVVSLLAGTSLARDWFVRAGSDGDGSKAKPFGDPWQALDKCEAGDAIHIAAGKYVGRTGVGYWEIPFDDVQLIGGYNADFTERNPWKNQTQLWWDKTSKNWPKQERLLSNHKGNVIDGLIIDQRDQCKYQDDQQTGRMEKPCDSAMRFSLPVTVKNCVIVNPGFDGIVAPVGSTFENNLIVNAVNWGINVNSLTSDKQGAAVIKNNSILFTYSFKEPGKGQYDGSAIGLKGNGKITDNIIAFSDSNGIYAPINPEKTVLSNNVFFLNQYSNAKFSVDGKDTPIDDKSMDSLDEVGLKAADGNVVKNPQFTFNAKWMDAVSKRASAIPGKLEMDDFNKFRQLAGIPMIAKGGTPPSGVAPAIDLDDALKFMAPKDAGKAGARIVPLTVNFQGAGAAAVTRDYKKMDIKQWIANPASVNGQALEMVVGISSVANIGGIPDQYKKTEYSGTTLHQPDGDFARVVGFFKNGSSVQRTVDGAQGYWNGSNGKPDRLWVVKGVAYAISWNPKGAFLIDSIEEKTADFGDDANRTVGRDWFVRAGAQGGDGSKEKPFKDPWQALEKVEQGDFVHVAEGEYFGKLKVGTWKVPVPYITLLGGYDANFKERNPWKHPTRLYSPADYKGTRGGYTIEGVDDHTGATVDGFVFDKKFNNQYEADGDLLYERSDNTEHIWFAKNGCVIRNNVFMNGSMGAIRAQSGQLIENNIFINHYQRTVKAERAFDGPFIFRNNTVLFAWEIKFGEGGGRGGNLLDLGTGIRGVVDNNIFEFADNDAIRLTTNAGDVEFTNNTFSHNLFSHVQRPSDWVSVDDKNWAQLADYKFKKVSGNQLISCGLPVDQKWFDVYLSRTAMVPGKVQMDDWNQLREMLGQPVIATGGKAGSGLSPAYPWDKAMNLFPKNPKCTAGARMKDLPVKFTGVARTEESFDYTDVQWDDSAADKNKWEALAGKRVAMKIVVRRDDNQFMLPEAPKEQFTVWMVSGPEGNDSPGLPLRAYVKKGGKAERTLNNAKSYSSGTPDQWYVIKGVAKTNRQMIIEVIERAD